MNDQPAPGYRSTEWWTTLASTALALLTALGVVHASDVATLQGALTAAVTAASAFASAAWVLVTYVKGRATLKAAHAAARGPLQGGM